MRTDTSAGQAFPAPQAEPKPSGNAPGSAVPGATNPPANPGSRGGGWTPRPIRPMAPSPKPSR